MVGGMGRKRIAGSVRGDDGLGEAPYPGRDRTNQDRGGLNGSGNMAQKHTHAGAAKRAFENYAPRREESNLLNAPTVFLGDGGFELIEELTVHRMASALALTCARACSCRVPCVYIVDVSMCTSTRSQSGFLHVRMATQLSRTENEALKGEIDALRIHVRELQERETAHLAQSRTLELQNQVACCVRFRRCNEYCWVIIMATGAEDLFFWCIHAGNWQRLAVCGCLYARECENAWVGAGGERGKAPGRERGASSAA